jgi:predicted dinucleotide-binding enzyme
MKIGIIGSGRIGSTTARLFVDAGHEVAIANSRGPDSLRELVSELGENAHAATAEEAVEFGDAVLLALPWVARESLPAGDVFAAKIVIDATNPFGEGGIIDVEPSTSSEEVAKLMPRARLVKAFNTLNWVPLGERAGEGLVLFVAGDDQAAKETVSDLIRDVGFEPVDTGSLAEGGRRQQPGSPLFNNPMTPDEARQLLTTA